MLDFTNFEQKYNSDCTTACIWMILKYYRVMPLPHYEELIDLTGCVPNGTTSQATIDTLTKFGLPVTYSSYSTLDHLRHWAEKGMPTIVSWFSTAPGSHSSIVRAVGPKNITLQDPATGRSRRMTIEEFEARWFAIDPYAPQRAAVRRPEDFVGFREAFCVHPPHRTYKHEKTYRKTETR